MNFIITVSIYYNLFSIFYFIIQN